MYSSSQVISIQNDLSTPLHACVNVGCMLQYKGVTQAFQHVTVIYDHLGARGARSGQQLCDSVGGAGKLPDLNVTSLMRTHIASA